MRYALFLVVFSLFFASCKEQKKSAEEPSHSSDFSEFKSENTSSFAIRFAADETTNAFLIDSTLYGIGNSISIVEKNGLTALQIETDKEFSDAYIDLVKLFGHPIDFSKGRYLSMKLLVPEGSWINAMKLNFKDSHNNFGGVGEFSNNFYGNYGKWMDVVVDLQELIPNYKSWQGEGNPLSKTSLLSLNPYNAHQADSSVIYVHSIRLSDTKLDLDYTPALAARVAPKANIPFAIDFDNDEKLRQYMAYRSFESSYQAMQKNVAGNTSMAIRLKGKEENKYIAFLPKLNEMTGKPVDFTKVSRIKFSYYLTEESEAFKGCSLYLVTENWNDILYDENVFSDFKKGEWTDITIEMKGLNLKLINGELPVLPSINELRFALEYFPGKKNIEMWIDNFEWE